jgi:hypothetical protein
VVRFAPGRRMRVGYLAGAQRPLWHARPALRRVPEPRLEGPASHPFRPDVG